MHARRITQRLGDRIDAPVRPIWSRVTTLIACGVSRIEVSVFEALRLRLATMPWSGPFALSSPLSTVIV
jgi:hypothetical protein